MKFPREYSCTILTAAPPLSRLYANANSPLVYPLLTRVFVFYPRYRYPFKNS